MGIYAGNKSLDAEITLDFIEREIQMDYSLNDYGNKYNSNTSVKLNDQWLKIPKRERLPYVIKDLILSCIVVPVYLLMPVFTELNQRKITGFKTQYNWQKFLKWFFSNLTGTYQKSHTGPLNGTLLEFKLPLNIWVEYNLTGDYQKYIKSISLKRNLIDHMRYGRFPRQVQKGWKVVFEFVEPPKDGSCGITHL
jgi:hypothetical protein